MLKGLLSVKVSFPVAGVWVLLPISLAIVISFPSPARIQVAS